MVLNRKGLQSGQDGMEMENGMSDLYPAAI